MRPVALAVALVALAACGGRTHDEGTADASMPTTTGQSGDGAPFTVPDAGACTPILPAYYDQTCTVDTDCTLVSEFRGCPVGCIECAAYAVNASVAAAYTTAVNAAFAANSGTACYCPSVWEAICQAGTCEVVAKPTEDAGPALPDSGWCSPYGPVSASEAAQTAAPSCDGLCVPIEAEHPRVPNPPTYHCELADADTETADAPEDAEPTDALEDAEPSDASACAAGMLACPGCGATYCADSGVCPPPPPCLSPVP